MSKQRIIFLLGIWIIILPFLGFPQAWKKFFFIVTGLILIFIAYLINEKSKTESRHTKKDGSRDVYADNRDEFYYQPSNSNSQDSESNDSNTQESRTPDTTIKISNTQNSNSPDNSIKTKTTQS